jgi:hypothetical protein
MSCSLPAGRPLAEILEEAARLRAQLLMQAALEAEVTEFLGRDRYACTAMTEDARPGSRNGYREVTVKTTAWPVAPWPGRSCAHHRGVRLPPVRQPRHQDLRARIARDCLLHPTAGCPQIAETVDLEIAARSPSASARVASTSRTDRPERFGVDLLDRADQARGAVADDQASALPRPPPDRRARRPLPGPLSSRGQGPAHRPRGPDCLPAVPAEHHNRIRHSNFIERTFGETRRRTKVIGRLPGETSCPTLVWAVLDRASRGWRGFTMTAAGLRLLQDLCRSLVDPPPICGRRPAQQPGAAGSLETVSAIA